MSAVRTERPGAAEWVPATKDLGQEDRQQMYDGLVADLRVAARALE